MRVITRTLRNKDQTFMQGEVLGSGVDFKGEPRFIVGLDDGSFQSWNIKDCTNAEVVAKQLQDKAAAQKLAEAAAKAKADEAAKKAQVEAEVRKQVEKKMSQEN